MEYFDLAAKVADLDGKSDLRTYLLGAIGIRARDGVVVSAKNLACQSTAKTEEFKRISTSHAESRCVAKMGRVGGVLYVARIRRRDRSFGMARPCGMCRVIIRSHNIDLVYYTIDPNNYGTWNPTTDRDTIFEM